MERIERVWRWFRHEMRMSISGASHRSIGTSAQHQLNNVQGCDGCDAETEWRARRQATGMSGTFREWITYGFKGPAAAGVWLPGDEEGHSNEPTRR